MKKKLQELYNKGLAGMDCPPLYLHGSKGYKAWREGFKIYEESKKGSDK